MATELSPVATASCVVGAHGCHPRVRVLVLLELMIWVRKMPSFPYQYFKFHGTFMVPLCGLVRSCFAGCIVNRLPSTDNRTSSFSTHVAVDDPVREEGPIEAFPSLPRCNCSIFDEIWPRVTWTLRQLGCGNNSFYALNKYQQGRPACFTDNENPKLQVAQVNRVVRSCTSPSRFSVVTFMNREISTRVRVYFSQALKKYPYPNNKLSTLQGPKLLNQGKESYKKTLLLL